VLPVNHRARRAKLPPPQLYLALPGGNQENMAKDLTGKSKFLSYVLRHQPESIGLTLDGQGWASIDELLAKCASVGNAIDRPLLEEIVGTNVKRRFTISPDGTRIRAAQGHSVDVELGLAPVEPPETLFHGTAQRFVAAILREGLRPGRRRHVHLSTDEPSAIAVGQRHGKPVVLRIASSAMRQAGYAFYRADNGVWLTDRVPPEFISD
jgi:putative RNA 2'-phosphotransferase